VLIYDIGMHNGDDTAYYLMKGAKAIAVEADPALCTAAKERFATEVADQSLTVLNVAVSDKEGEADFFLSMKTLQSRIVCTDRNAQASRKCA
jgi:FkbM family methyltransferase